MSLRVRYKSAEESDNNIFWTTMADLLLGLSIIFMTLFVLAMSGFTQQEIIQKRHQMEIGKELVEKLKEANINAEVDSLTGDIKISDLELFETGSYTLSPKGKSYLNKFTPIYVNTIFSKEDIIEEIENIVVQGHTDSQSFAGIKNKDEQYIRNMALSLQRANSIADYMFKTNFNKQYNDRLKKILVVEGKSFSTPILVDGKEDYNKSRRVELHLKLKKLDISDIIFFGAKR